MQLKKELELVIEKIIIKFCKKNELYFEFWVKDDVTSVACFSFDEYYSLSDICFDLFSNQPKFRISLWQQECIDNSNFDVNYESYCMGKNIDKKTKTTF